VIHPATPSAPPLALLDFLCNQMLSCQCVHFPRLEAEPSAREIVHAHDTTLCPSDALGCEHISLNTDGLRGWQVLQFLACSMEGGRVHRIVPVTEEPQSVFVTDRIWSVIVGRRRSARAPWPSRG
jgi:hypothetical protein